MPIKSKFVQTVTVIDPDSVAGVEIEIRKLETGGMMGVDASYLEQDVGPVYSPYDRGIVVAISSSEEPPTVNRCPISYPHQPHDYCDGTPASTRKLPMPATTDELLQWLADKGIVAFLRNCKVGTLNGIPATFDYTHGAALQWTKGAYMSRRHTTEAEGETALQALQKAIAKAKEEGCPDLE